MIGMINNMKELICGARECSAFCLPVLQSANERFNCSFLIKNKRNVLTDYTHISIIYVI